MIIYFQGRCSVLFISAAGRNILIEFLSTTGSLAIFFFLFINYIASKTNTDTLELPSVDLLPE